MSNTNLANLSLGYTASYSCTSGCATAGSPRQVLLDGVELSITYTVASGGLSPARGCITQTPYYNPNDHSPAYNGACALFRVESDAERQAPPPGVRWRSGAPSYAPSAALDVPVDVLTVPVFNRGVVARMLMLGYQVAANSTQVPLTTAPLTGATTAEPDRHASPARRRDGRRKVDGDTSSSATSVAQGSQPPAHPGRADPVVVYSWQVTR